MTGELKINEIMLVILMMIGVACCIYFLIKGKKTAKVDGLLYTDNNIDDDDGINIGSYYPNADAYIRFRERIVDRNLVQGTNRLVLWGQVTNWIPEHEDDQGIFVDKKGETLQDNADVYVDK